MLVSFCGGTAHFINGFLDRQDFDVSCLYFSGFLVVELIFRWYQLKYEVKSFSKDSIMKLCFGNFYKFDENQINWYYTIHVFLRSFALILVYWFGIKSIYFAKLANINIGIISSCFIFSIVINVTAGFLFFNEKINLKETLGILITIAGIVWISLSRGQSTVSVTN